MMARKSKSARRQSWAGLIRPFRFTISILIALVAGWFSFTVAVSGVSRSKNPELALKFVPSESNALSLQADQLFFDNLQSPPKRVSQMARTALRQQAINAKALRILGFVADVQNRPAKAAALVKLSAKLSRREPGAQLWLIEKTARDETATQTLGYYDVLLSTKQDSSALLFPRLLAAIDDREIRTALLPYILTDRNWVTMFISHAISNSRNLPALVDLLEVAGGVPKTDMAPVQNQGLLARLVDEKLFADARRFFLTIPGAKAQRLTDASFDTADQNAKFGIMGWSLFNGPDGGSAFSQESKVDKPTLSLFINAETTRTVATKLLYFTPGDYLFSAKLARIKRGDRGTLNWQMRCASAGGATTLWLGEMSEVHLTAHLTIPSQCPEQYLDLVVSGGRNESGLEATIDSVQISLDKS